MTKVEVVFTDSSNELINKTYEGRLLPLITASNFIDIVNDKLVRNQLYTSETIKVSSIVEELLLKDDKTMGLRLALAIKKINDKECDLTKRLFISEPLHFISYASPDKKEVSFSTKNGNGWLKLQEGA